MKTKIIAIKEIDQPTKFLIAFIKRAIHLNNHLHKLGVAIIKRAIYHDHPLHNLTLMIIPVLSKAQALELLHQNTRWITKYHYTRCLLLYFYKSLNEKLRDDVEVANAALEIAHQIHPAIGAEILRFSGKNVVLDAIRKANPEDIEKIYKTISDEHKKDKDIYEIALAVASENTKPEITEIHEQSKEL